MAAVALSLLLSGSVLVGGTIAGWAAQCPAKPYDHTPEATKPLNIGELKLQVLDYLCFGQYDRDIARVLAEARSYLETVGGKVAKPALVLDIDETSLSKRAQLLANDFGFIRDGPCDRLPEGPCGSKAWDLRHQAPAIRPTRDLFDAAKANGIAVFFITGRGESAAERSATARNLSAAGYEGWTGLILRPPGYASTDAYKTAMRAAIEAHGYTIVANVGDQHSDLRGGHAQRVWKLPNPFYFIP